MKVLIIRISMLLGISFFSSFFVTAQSISFAKGLSWVQIKEKAISENKYIFLDVYATWCVPCKQMDSIVYNNNKVSELMNSQFISAKIQFDQTPNDDDQIKSRYSDVKELTSKYHVGAFPTYLFFSPAGKLLKKGSGFSNADAFISIVNEALNPEILNFYADLDNYDRGLKDYKNMPTLIRNVKNLLENKQIEQRIAKDYKINYLDKLPLDLLYTKEHLDFAAEYPLYVNSKDNYYKIIQSNPIRIDSIMNQKGWSDRVKTNIIILEEVYSKLYSDSSFTRFATESPDWTMMNKSILLKYGKEYTDLLIPQKIYFYLKRNEWKKFAAVVDKKIAKYPPKMGVGLFDSNSTFSYNGYAWDVFLYCNDSEVLKQALEWVDLAIKTEGRNPNAQYLDTKANLLYKLGRVKLAIETEQLAIEMGGLNLKHMGVEGKFDATDYENIIKKMKMGLPTWKESK